MSLKNKNELKIPVLAYHSIDDSGSVISTSPKKFCTQMKFLAESCFNVIPLRDVVIRIKEKRPFPEKTLAITFDDGFKDIYKEAYPVLKEYGFTATIFLVTGLCGRNNKWNGQPQEIPIMDLLGWKEIEKMAGGGMDFGAHTVSHPNLSELPEERAYEEIVKSKLMLQEHLGENEYCFAYPYGSQPEAIKKVVKEHFLGACTAELDFVTMESNIHEMPRIEMYYFSGNKLFSYLGNSAFSYFIKFRKVLRSLRA
jgi:peptidoglycan/xylan/chitin deacetylase (PgdA/CDA1 family)